MEMAVKGGGPPNEMAAAEGVSLTRPERTFLDTLTDPLAGEGITPALLKAGRSAGLREEDVAFIHEWVVCQGVHWLTCEHAEIAPIEGAKVFRNPVVRRIIDAAAATGFCLGTSAARDELESYYTQRIRNPFLPEALRDNAADKLAKLKGWYTDGPAKGGNSVMIVFNDPYATRVDAVEVEAKSAAS